MFEKEAQAFISNLDSCTQQPEALERARPLRKVHRGTPSAWQRLRPTDERVGYARGESERTRHPTRDLGRREADAAIVRMEEFRRSRPRPSRTQTSRRRKELWSARGGVRKGASRSIDLAQLLVCSARERNMRRQEECRISHRWGEMEKVTSYRSAGRDLGDASPAQGGDREFSAAKDASRDTVRVATIEAYKREGWL